MGRHGQQPQWKRNEAEIQRIEGVIRDQAPAPGVSYLNN